jgi:hypothetical protein
MAALPPFTHNVLVNAQIPGVTATFNPIPVGIHTLCVDVVRFSNKSVKTAVADWSCDASARSIQNQGPGVVLLGVLAAVCGGAGALGAGSQFEEPVNMFIRQLALAAHNQ